MRSKQVKKRRALAGTIAGIPVVTDTSVPPGEIQLRSHDPKKCRVYRCIMCQALKVKDPHRGLT